MTEEATERGELRELLFDGVAPPPDAEAMFDRTFAATGDDGAHLLPADGMFDEPADDPIVVEDPPTDLYVDDPAIDDPSNDGAAGDSTVEWANGDDTTHGADDTGDAGTVDHHHDW